MCIRDSCTIAQVICESGQGDAMSQLATRDHNLFGIKWASSFASCPEVAGKASWATHEEVGGQVVTVMADFTVFKSDADCIRFRSRVLLQNSRYADNAFIKEAIADHDSDKMAEGLKDAGYATSSEYVESLKSVMRTYNLYRFDGMGVGDFEKGAAGGDAIVQAAYSQLGVPYVWGGSTPGVGLDCSGLTQYCYRQAGISISHYTEDQLKELTVVPLSLIHIYVVPESERYVTEGAHPALVGDGLWRAAQACLRTREHLKGVGKSAPKSPFARGLLRRAECGHSLSYRAWKAVSYTHLDVYKRQR